VKRVPNGAFAACLYPTSTSGPAAPKLNNCSIFSATIRDQQGTRYMNCGDWVESCTALVEHEDGRFEIVTWTDPMRRTIPVSLATARAA
jgi:hypothetical protein